VKRLAVLKLGGELIENEQRLKQAMNNLERALNPRQPKPKRQAATA